MKIQKISCLFVLGLLIAGLSSHGYTQEANPDITEHFNRMLVYHKYMDGNVPEGSVLFIGDSITQGLCVAAVHPSAINYGIGSDTTLGVLERLPVYKSAEQAAAIVFAIGVNDLSRRDNDAIVENYQKIIQAVPAHVPLLFSAILPLDERNKPEEKHYNQRILELNTCLKDLCEKKDYAFLDMTPILADDTGNLKPSYHTGDGVHLNTEGYALWIQKLRASLEFIETTAQEKP
ncbi:MAG: GDSL family lipase [Candidatus Hydrogenedentes bacterium]|jgi:lysophospholipase L1-like esterase|nr:GDSL family lipase [Candidatus Hydrogenedentota bacterium]